ncbi:AAA family ATPase [Bacillus tianshenii]|nr:AAA family ATPase [Bacillus tianshenii]
MFTVCFAEQAKSELQSLDSNELELVDKRIESLRNGRWKNGTRVKKLRSINKKLTVFEARVDRGNRMLFTLYPEPSDERNKTIILIFNLSVKHDDVIHTARYVLDDQISMEEYINEKELEQPFTDFVKETESIWNQQHFFNQFDQLKSYEIDEETIIRFMQKDEVNADEFWDLKLRLTKEQRDVLNQPLPILMSGTAGSGKTTIIIHKLLSEPAVSKLYLTYSDELRDEAKKQFLSLVKGLDDEHQLIRNTTFRTFHDLLKEDQKDEFQVLSTRDHFQNYYQKFARGQQLEKQFPFLMVWEEIRGVLKGGIFAKDSYTLSQQQYEALGHLEAPNFIKKRRDMYENIFQPYQDWLKKSYYIDEQDLLNEKLQSEIEHYNMVICDEVQDLTMLHLQLVAALANDDCTRIILAGDDHQVVHHSGFRWENVKNMFYQQYNIPVKNIVQLSKNFRNSGTIAALASEINNLQHDYTDFKYKTSQIEYFNTGKEPVLFESLKEETIIEQFHQFGPHDAILVRDEEVRKNLHKTFHSLYNYSPLIFTVFQAKGLEFNRVLLWSMLEKDSEQAKMWNQLSRIIHNNERYKIKENQIMQRFIRYEASLFYVAVTRGMKECFIYDGTDSSSFWKLANLSSKLSVMNKLATKQAKQVEKTLPEDWLQTGKQLLKKKMYEQALECFNRIQNDSNVKQEITICEAYIAKQDGDYTAAGPKFKAVELFEEALHCFEAGEDYDEIERLSNYVIRYVRNDKELKDKWEYIKSANKVKSFDHHQQWNGSGAYCKRIKRYMEAIYRYEKEESNVTKAYINAVFVDAMNDPELSMKELKQLIEYFKHAGDEEKVLQLTQKQLFLKEMAYIQQIMELLTENYNQNHMLNIEQQIFTTFPITLPLRAVSKPFDFGKAEVKYAFALLADHLGEDEAIIQQLMEEAAEQNHVEAQFHIACSFYDAGNVEQALHWFHKASENDHPFALFNIGLIFAENGNEKETVKWYEQAAERGFEDAMSDLSIYYREGKAVRKNKKKAAYWQEKCKEMNNQNKAIFEDFKQKISEIKAELDKQF